MWGRALPTWSASRTWRMELRIRPCQHLRPEPPSLGSPECPLEKQDLAARRGGGKGGRARHHLKVLGNSSARGWDGQRQFMSQPGLRWSNNGPPKTTDRPRSLQTSPTPVWTITTISPSAPSSPLRLGGHFTPLSLCFLFFKTHPRGTEGIGWSGRLN